MNTFKRLTQLLPLALVALLISCHKDVHTDPVIGLGVLNSETVTDIDGNIYHTITLGSQVWMVENLKVTRYNNGDLIPNVTDRNQWPVTVTGAYCNYLNNEVLNETYGRLYNWYAVSDVRKVAPPGWRVATDYDWSILVAYAGGDTFAGGKLKESGTGHWLEPNTAATNVSLFDALPGGTRSGVDGQYDGIGLMGFWWTNHQQITDTSNPLNYNISYNNGWAIGMIPDGDNRTNGMSVRCIKY